MLELQLGINGLLLGGIYALMAFGMALVWGVLNIVNIAHGAFIVLGGYVTYWLFKLWGIDPFLTIPVSMLLMFLLGYAIQSAIINKIVRAEIFFTLLVTFGLDLIIINVAQIFWTADFRTVDPSYSGTSINIGELAIPVVRIAAFVVAIGITLGLLVMLRRTKLGRAIRAVSQDLDAARISGVNLGRTYAVTYGIAAALAGAAGSLLILLMAFYPAVGGPFTLKSFVISVLGGLSSPFGPIIGGLTLGLAEEFGAAYLGETFRNAISFSILVLILIFRPQGILGKRAHP